MKRLLGAFCLLFVAVALYAQERTITGVVVDAELNNDPLPGATISVATTGSRVETGAVSDYEGRFTLKVDSLTKSFTVRYLGYQAQTVNIIAGKSEYTIALKSDAKGGW